MVLIFPVVLIVFSILSFEFQQVRLPWLQRQSTGLSGLGLGTMLES